MVTGIAVFLALTDSVLAQDVLEEITVTAQRRSQNLQDVPVAVTAFSSTELESRNIQNIAGIADATPNLMITTGGTGNNVSNVFIRGIGQGSNQVFFDQGVGTYVDGVYRPSLWGGLFDLLNVERIEVLRGPQGDLYGKNAIGGAVNIISRQPDAEEMFGSVTLAGGSFNRIDARGFVNVPVVPGKFGLQLAAGSRNADGYIDTPQGDGLNSQENTAFRIAGKWNITDAFQWTASVDRIDSSSSGPPFHHLEILDGSRINAQYNDAVTQGVLGNAPLISDAFLTNDPFRSNITGEQHRTNSQETTFVNRLDFDLGFATLVSLTSYKDLNADDGFDADGTPLDVSANNRVVDGESKSQEFQLNGSAFNDRLDYLLGLYYLDDDIVFSTFAENSIQTDPFVGILPGFVDRSTRNVTHQTLESFAAFANFSYAVSDAMTLIVGLRYMNEEKEVFGGLTNTASTAPEFTFASGEESWSNVSPRVQLKYNYNEDSQIYLSVSNGFKSGGINNQVIDDGLGGTLLIPYQEEEVTSYEFGLKSDWVENTVRTNFAVFYMDYEDLQANLFNFSLVTGTQIRTIVNSGGATISGAEAEVVWLASENFTLQATAAYLDTEFDQDVVDSRGRTIFVGGDPLAFAPEFSYSLSGIYTVPVGDDGSFTLRGDYSWRDDVFFEPDGTIEDRLEESEEAYGLLNLSVTYDSGNDWSISLYGTNVTDETYTTNTFVQRGFVGAAWDLIGRPAEWGLKVGYDF